MHEFDEEVGTRERIEQNGEKYYFTITEKSIQFHAANEGDIKLQPLYSLINTSCRLASKLRGLGMPWKDVANQFEAGSMGNPTVWPWLISHMLREKFGIQENKITNQ